MRRPSQKGCSRSSVRTIKEDERSSYQWRHRKSSFLCLPSWYASNSTSTILFPLLSRCKRYKKPSASLYVLWATPDGKRNRDLGPGENSKHTSRQNAHTHKINKLVFFNPQGYNFVSGLCYGNVDFGHYKHVT